MQWLEEIMAHSIFEVILAGAADHRQYPNPHFDEEFTLELASEYHRYKAFAQNHGFSIKNPSKFFIQHVYVTYLDAQNIDL
jgi:hypothetical protein